jgi:hypothetical protein
MSRSRIPFNAEELAFIEARKEMPRQALHVVFVTEFQRTDVAVDHIKSLCTRRGWTKRTWWTPADDAKLCAEFPHRQTRGLAQELGRSESSTHNRAHKLGLHKTDAYLASPDACRLRRGDNVGAAFRFTKGQVPPNKGKKMPPGWAPGRMRETQFVKGQKGSKYMPIGSTRLIDGYEYTKVSDVPKVAYSVNWKATHILNWEAIHGPMPKGHALKSLDGDRLNVTASNWQLVPRAMLPRLSGGPHHQRLNYDIAPAALRPTLMAVARLEHAAHTRKRVNREARA